MSLQLFRNQTVKQSFYIYIFKSLNDNVLYVGSTSNVRERLKRHNKGDYRYSKGHRPWKLVHQEAFRTRSEAVKRERYLKTGIGREELALYR